MLIKNDYYYFNKKNKNIYKIKLENSKKQNCFTEFIFSQPDQLFYVYAMYSLENMGNVFLVYFTYIR